ncbi:DUF427-domain-containing protein [Gonapodya prolifera JEL478]|uniref:DUF427-domain-containing protein n=1 Tax=Gonapodya prolifera (strain JEL478) TaxID=1344416 RepID=A0A139AV87_GONPJ|nr:DUF427-domain-containing protein [Gonapodya prolifera JEL478]|eukprot:KXS20614.1 DUF427-domain-containing protein [Gonapodya prolifera JEL478]
MNDNMNNKENLLSDRKSNCTPRAIRLLVRPHNVFALRFCTQLSLFRCKLDTTVATKQPLVTKAFIQFPIANTISWLQSSAQAQIPSTSVHQAKRMSGNANPRPATFEPTPRHLKVQLGDTVIAETRRGVRVLETSHPPAYYFPPEDINQSYLRKVAGKKTFCEWKGVCEYYDITADGKAAKARAWTYPSPSPSFKAMANYVSFYASPFTCFVDGERVQPQEGDFYGGWITDDLEGPFKGAPGTWGW